MKNLFYGGVRCCTICQSGVLFWFYTMENYNMATSKPRFTITVSDDAQQAITAYARALGVPNSRVISDVLEAAKDGFLAAARVIETGKKIQTLGEEYIQGYSSVAGSLGGRVDSAVSAALSDGFALGLVGEDLIEASSLGVDVSLVSASRLSSLSSALEGVKASRASNTGADYVKNSQLAKKTIKTVH